MNKAISWLGEAFGNRKGGDAKKTLFEMHGELVEMNGELHGMIRVLMLKLIEAETRIGALEKRHDDQGRRA